MSIPESEFALSVPAFKARGGSLQPTKNRALAEALTMAVERDVNGHKGLNFSTALRLIAARKTIIAILSEVNEEEPME